MLLAINFLMRTMNINEVTHIDYKEKYELKEEYTQTRGLDLSEYQRGINFDSIKNNYDFVILRAGFTGYGDGVSKHMDLSFEDFYQKAKERGLNVGAYYYSCANSYEKGLEEAKFLYENALKGKTFEYPIYIDVEESRYQKIGKITMAEAIKGFCDYLESVGYYGGVYANNYYFNNYIETNMLSRYPKWLAYWTSTKPNFNYGKYGLWQNSNSGYVDGYRVDTNYSYEDYPRIMKEYGLNGYSIVKEEEEKREEELQSESLEEVVEESVEEQAEEVTEEPKEEVLEEPKEEELEPEEEVIVTLEDNKDEEEIAEEVISGIWGNNENRKETLERHGYNYENIQRIVNSKVIETINYIVKSGDTLFNIARRYYGDGYKYKVISDYNNIKNPNLIYVNDKIIIPFS